jgi:hypothetical protein
MENKNHKIEVEKEQTKRESDEKVKGEDSARFAEEPDHELPRTITARDMID